MLWLVERMKRAANERGRETDWEERGGPDGGGGGGEYAQ